MPALLFSIFFACNCEAQKLIVDDEVRGHIAQQKRWHSLLHLKGQYPAIGHSAFLLSSNNFTPRAELDFLITYFNNARREATCRFPARLYWLHRELGISTENLDFGSCAELTKYISHVPFDAVDIVFASEVLSSASSMMGHVFLKAEGDNYRGNRVSHALSFFTEYDSYNPFRIVYDGLINGMQGFFIVRPYEKELTRYLTTESRNVFEYTLRLDEGEKTLLQLHMWELKDIDITYLFQSYNCATLTLYLLGIITPEIKAEESLFVTPADVVKAASKLGLITLAKANLANEWALAALELQLGEKRTSELKNALAQTKSVGQEKLEELTPVELEYVKRLITITNQITPSLHYWYSEMDQAAFPDSELKLNRKAAKNPQDTAQDSIVSIALETLAKSERAVISLVPASHYLRTYEPQFFNESELLIAETELSVNTKSGNVRLDRFTLYSFDSYMPSTQNLPNLSGTLFIGYKQEFNDVLRDKGFFIVEGGLGKSFRFHRDVISYSVAQLGLGTRISEGTAYGRLKSGIVLNLAWQSSLRIEASLKYSDRLNRPLVHYLAELASQPSQSNGIYFRLEHFDTSQREEVMARIGFDLYF